MKSILFIKLSFIVFFFILEVKGAKKKTKANNNNNIIKNEGPANSVLAESAYCQHFKDSKIYLDKTKLDKLDTNQYINSEFATNKEAFSDGAKLDYYIRYSLISRGLCYYEENEVQEINKFPSFYYNNLNTWDTMRYDKTFNCYYYYNLYALPESKEELKKHALALNHVAQYLNGVYNFIYNSTLCPNPKENMIGTHDNDANAETFYFNDRVKYVTELEEFYNNLDLQYKNEHPNDILQYETILEHDTSNIEICQCGNYLNYIYNLYFCVIFFYLYLLKIKKKKKKKIKYFLGYPTPQQKEEYCKAHNNNEICCHLEYLTTPYIPVFYKQPLYYGIAVASVLVIMGSYFSSKIIQEIKMQENIKKSILNQEKEYQQSHEKNLLNAYKEGFDPSKQTFNTNYRNLSGTLSTMSSNPRVNTMGKNNGGSMDRLPPNSYTVIEDFDKEEKERDITLRKGMIVQLLNTYEGGWVTVRNIQTNEQGYAPAYCLGNKIQ